MKEKLAWKAKLQTKGSENCTKLLHTTRTARRFLLIKNRKSKLIYIENMRKITRENIQERE